MKIQYPPVFRNTLAFQSFADRKLGEPPFEMDSRKYERNEALYSSLLEGVEELAMVKLDELGNQARVYEYRAEIKEPVAYEIYGNEDKQFSYSWFVAAIYLYRLEEKRKITKAWENYWNKFTGYKETPITPISNKINWVDFRNRPVENYLETEVRHSSNKLVAKCPFHEERTPSFTIFNDNSFHCFGCGAHGRGAIDFVCLRDGVEPIEAIQKL